MFPYVKALGSDMSWCPLDDNYVIIHTKNNKNKKKKIYWDELANNVRIGWRFSISHFCKAKMDIRNTSGSSITKLQYNCNFEYRTTRANDIMGRH
jgi:hypothetical protein